jgi:hypothetical protein
MRTPASEGRTADLEKQVCATRSERYKRKFIQTLDNLRAELRFKIIGYVLIRRLTDFHVLIWPGPAANPSRIMQKLSEPTANFILRNLRQNLSFPRCKRC